MAIQLNLQGIVDARVARMLKSDDEVKTEAAVYKNLRAELIDGVDNVIDKLAAKLDAEQAKSKPNPTVVQYYQKALNALMA